VVQSGGAQLEIALFGHAGGHRGRAQVRLAGGCGVSGLFEQVRAYRFETVVVSHPVVVVERAE